MKVLMINGSPHANGNTAVALHEMERIFQQEKIEVERIHVGNQEIRGCIGCASCKKRENVFLMIWSMILREGLNNAMGWW